MVLPLDAFFQTPLCGSTFRIGFPNILLLFELLCWRIWTNFFKHLSVVVLFVLVFQEHY